MKPLLSIVTEGKVSDIATFAGKAVKQVAKSISNPLGTAAEETDPSKQVLRKDLRTVTSKTPPVNESADMFYHILRRFPMEVKTLKATGELSKHLYDSLYDYYVDENEMPYDVMKGMTTDPMDWVADRTLAKLKRSRQQLPDAPLDEDIDTLDDSKDFQYDSLEDELSRAYEIDAEDKEEGIGGYEMYVVWCCRNNIPPAPPDEYYQARELEPIGHTNEWDSVNEADDLAGIRKLAGLQATDKKVPVVREKEDGDVMNQVGSPTREFGITAILPSGTDMNRKKHAYARSQPGDNAMAVDAIAERLMNAFDKY